RTSRPWLLVPPGLVFCLLLLGCPADNRYQDDPLVGGAAPVPPPPAGIPPAPGTTAPTAAATGVPPLPPVTQTSSTASMAGGSPVPDTRPLGIADPNGQGSNPSTWGNPVARGADTAAGNTTLNGAIQPIVPAARKEMDPVHGMTVLDEGKSALGQGAAPDS